MPLMERTNSIKKKAFLYVQNIRPILTFGIETLNFTKVSLQRIVNAEKRIVPQNNATTKSKQRFMYFLYIFLPKPIAVLRPSPDFLSRYRCACQPTLWVIPKKGHNLSIINLFVL